MTFVGKHVPKASVYNVWSLHKARIGCSPDYNIVDTLMSLKRKLSSFTILSMMYSCKQQNLASISILHHFFH